MSLKLPELPKNSYLHLKKYIRKVKEGITIEWFWYLAKRVKDLRKEGKNIQRYRLKLIGKETDYTKAEAYKIALKIAGQEEEQEGEVKKYGIRSTA